jgi:uncharacterized repeat protein (TIGR03803 family)
MASKTGDSQHRSQPVWHSFAGVNSQQPQPRKRIDDLRRSNLGLAATAAVLALIMTPGLVTVGRAQTATFRVPYSFTDGPDGFGPLAPVVRDSAGNLYGTSSSMVPPPASPGSANCPNPGSCGAVFKVSVEVGGEITLHSFMGAPDGARPLAGLVRDASGNLYGTTELGGAACASQFGCGTVFKIDSSGTETVLYSFTGGADGGTPMAGLLRDPAGNLYGTTYYGGDLSCNSGTGCGIVFQLSSAGVETVLYSFHGGTDGELPAAGLVRDPAGNFYGTTLLGGTFGSGTVFELGKAGKEKVLYAFTGGADGSLPLATLVLDAAGNLYGTTQLGGAYGAGTVFEVGPAGSEQVLHSFAGGSDGIYPFAGVVMDSAGNLYGTTFSGGGEGLCEDGCGTVFELSADGSETILHSFTGHSDGGYPRAALILDAAGNLYGTAEIGGALGYGDVFMLKR